MKLTREMLHEAIDNYPNQISAETLFIDITHMVLTKCPHILPYYCQAVGHTISDIFDSQERTLRLSNERASYLETYLRGEMYPEDIAKKPEYIDIQRGHATTIKNETAKSLGIKKEVE